MVGTVPTQVPAGLTAAPTRAWRGAFLSSSPALTNWTYTPDIGRLAIRAKTPHLRTEPAHLMGWLRRLDRWIRYANSVGVEE